MELQVIKVRPFAKEYLMFIYIAVKAFYSHLPIIIYALMRKNADVIIIKLNNKVIGGFILSDLPLNIFRLKNLLSKQKRDCLWKFIKMGYRYLTYVVIDKKHRNKGYGKELFNRAKKEYNIKSYLTPFTSGLQKFYENLGAKVYHTEDGHIIEGLKTPIMVFDNN